MLLYGCFLYGCLCTATARFHYSFIEGKTSELVPIAHSCNSSLGAEHQRVIYVARPILPDSGVSNGSFTFDSPNLSFPTQLLPLWSRGLKGPWLLAGELVNDQTSVPVPPVAPRRLRPRP